MTKIFIDGSAGTTGLKIHERLSARKDIELLRIPEEKRKDPDARRECINASDIAFLCLPDDAAREAAAMASSDKLKIIDASTAHRTLPGWSYGFPELSASHRKAVETGSRIAVPGCHASGFISIAYPLRALSLLPADYPLVCFSLTGYTGGGKGMIAEYESENRSPLIDAPRQYAIGQEHKHLREMQAVCSLSHPPIFSPIVADFPRGMQVSLPLYSSLLLKKAGARDIHSVLSEYYAGSKIVSVLPFMGEGVFEKGFVPSNLLAGKDSMKLLVGGNDERILICSVFDNLGKGASGAAVQCMNIALGLDETTGLELD